MAGAEHKSVASSSVTIVIAKEQLDFCLPDGYLHLGTFMFSIIVFSEHLTVLIVSIYTTFKWEASFIQWLINATQRVLGGKKTFSQQATIC